jgi:hypothetical protein
MMAYIHGLASHSADRIAVVAIIAEDVGVGVEAGELGGGARGGAGVVCAGFEGVGLGRGAAGGAEDGGCYDCFLELVYEA